MTRLFFHYQKSLGLILVHVKYHTSSSGSSLFIFFFCDFFPDFAAQQSQTEVLSLDEVSVFS